MGLDIEYIEGLTLIKRVKQIQNHCCPVNS
jgi:hypothetical protein